jgi:hypothetical protein
VRFYVPEWDDAVDAHYDFEHDELSTLDRGERELSYIWDIFNRETTPIDGVLISREKVEESRSKTARLRDFGVYEDPVLSIPNWLPTISDCGAWGYKSLPFPPYANQGMLEFYDQLDVSIGVTIDHLVLGSGKDKGRLYLDERAFNDEFDLSDIPDELTEVVDLMTDEWPDEWPNYVAEYDLSICTAPNAKVEPFSAETFEGDPETVLERLATDPRAVYRTDDKQFRYDLTLRNAREMYGLYQKGDYPFRLMVAVQGWDSETYVEATQQVLDIGYRYVGLGGVAGSPIQEVRKIVKDVGETVKGFERDHSTRVDHHVFGFAKADAFETIGRSGVTSFDSASMLRSAWTGGGNYRLDDDERYDGIRVRYPPHGADIEVAVEHALRARETLVALQAYGDGSSIPAALQEWNATAETALGSMREYLRENRHVEKYDDGRIQELETTLRDDFEYAREFKSSFSEDLRKQLIKYLRSDDPEDPRDFSDYEQLLESTADILDEYPRSACLYDHDDEWELDAEEFTWMVVSDYALWRGDDDLLDEYRTMLADRPWERCDCPICSTIGIQVAIFRGNDRNRRRGFHNTRRFYDEFDEELPKTLVVTQGTASLTNGTTVEEYLQESHSEFWEDVHDLPVAEVGAFDANGVHEWWDETPSQVSFAPGKLADNIGDALTRYRNVFIHAPDGRVEDRLERLAAEHDCSLQTVEDTTDLRKAVLESFGENYSVGTDFVPHAPEIPVDSDLKILVIDQCSGSKDVPEDVEEFERDVVDGHTKDELLDMDNVPGIRAIDLYTGRQQEYITTAVRTLRHQGIDVERYFISAGFGLVDENERLPPYEVTFSGMRANEVRERSDNLDIETDVQRLLTGTDYDVVFFALGKDYYRSIDIDEAVRSVTPDRIGVVFNRDLVNDQYKNVVSVPARTDDAKRHGTIVIGLKGLYLKNFAQRLGGVDVLDPETISMLCRRVDSTQQTMPTD